MQEKSDDAVESRRDFGAIAATALAGMLIAGFAALGCSALAAQRPLDDVEIADRALHNLTPGECRLTVSSLLEKSHDDPRVLWVWVEESVPNDPSIDVMTLPATLSREVPRPYAFRANVTDMPDGTCGFKSNSVHVLSEGGVAMPLLGTAMEAWPVLSGS